MQSSSDTWQVFLSGCLFPHDVGARLWLVCMLKNHGGHGPNAWPLPRLGGFARSHNGTGVVLQLLSVGPLTECGLVALTDLAIFFWETDWPPNIWFSYLWSLALLRGSRMDTCVSPVLCRLGRTRQLPTWCMTLRSCGT